MPFVPSTDKRPVYLDSLGQPLASGKLLYTSGLVADLKTVYSDPGGTEALNPQDLGADGRTPTEIFLGTGAYTVYAYRFEGVDPTIEPFPGPTWVEDHRWEDFGLESVDPSVISVATVATIAELAALDPTAYTRANVLGYYAEGDLYPRFYEWDAFDNQAGNLGTVIKNGTSSNGCWKTVIGESSVVDCRIFGAFAGRVTPCNANIAAATSWVQSTAGAPASVYFPQGTYKVSGNDTAIFNCGIKTDPGVYFHNTVADTTYVLQINGTFDIAGTAPFKAGTSLGAVTLTFSGAGNDLTVRSAWWGLVANEPVQHNTVGAKLLTIFASVPESYTVIMDARVDINSLSSDLVIPNRLVFTGNARLNNNQSTHTVQFIAPGSIVNQTTVTATSPAGMAPTVRGILTGVLWKYKFTNYGEVRSNWFANDTGSGNTINLLPLFSSDALDNFSVGTRFVFDHPTNVFGTGGEYDTSLVAANLANLVFEHELGVVTRADPVRTTQVMFPYNNFSPGYFVASDKVMPVQPITRLSNFYPPGATDTVKTVGFGRALRCAVYSGGVLDLGGESISLTSTSTLATGPGCTVRNGTLIPLSAAPVITVNVAVDRLLFFNVTVEGDVASPLIQVSSGATIGQLGMDYCTYACSATTTSMIKTTGTGSIAFLDIGSSVITTDTIINTTNAGGILRANIHNNPGLSGDLITDGCCLIAEGNYITGGPLAMWQYSCTDSAIFSNNRLYACDLRVMDNGGVIDAVVTGNQFESTTGHYCRIALYSRTGGTYFGGATITGNSWIGVAPSTVRAGILAYPTPKPYAQSNAGVLDKWNNKYYAQIPDLANAAYHEHRICIKDNTSSHANMLIPTTSGAVPNFTTPGDRFYFDQNPAIFYMLGSSSPSLNYLNVVPRYTYGETHHLRYEGCGADIVMLNNRDYVALMFSNATGVAVDGYAGEIELYSGTSYVQA